MDSKKLANQKEFLEEINRILNFYIEQCTLHLDNPKKLQGGNLFDVGYTGYDQFCLYTIKFRIYCPDKKSFNKFHISFYLSSVDMENDNPSIKVTSDSLFNGFNTMIAEYNKKYL